MSWDQNEASLRRSLRGRAVQSFGRRSPPTVANVTQFLAAEIVL
jgi:hypothetical protein